jgi:hypothetical protein
MSRFLADPKGFEDPWGLIIKFRISFLFPLYAYVMFSQKGGRFQEKVYNLIIQSLGAKVRLLTLEIILNVRR